MTDERRATVVTGRNVILAPLAAERQSRYGDLRSVTAADYASFANGTSERRRQAAFEDYMKIETLRGRTPDRTAWMSAHPPGFAEHREAFSPNGKYGRWLRSLPAILKIGDTVFLLQSKCG